MSLVMVAEMLRTGLDTPESVTHLISYSVRWAVPLIYVIAAASALHTLVPGPVTTWLMRNRKYVGFAFAIAMAWQGLFIFMVSTFHRDYYFGEIFLLRDELEGSTGYVFLAAMVVTSFEFGRRLLSASQWKLLHRSGVYFLWAYPFAVYWWAVFYYPEPELLDYVFYGAGFAAFALRIAAWGRKRQRDAARASTGSVVPAVNRFAGTGLAGLGLVAAATGLFWQEPVSMFLTSAPWSANLELWLPFWPFEPFLPLVAIGLGTLIATTQRATPHHAAIAPRH